jgi:hypothetical protein
LPGNPYLLPYRVPIGADFGSLLLKSISAS